MRNKKFKDMTPIEMRKLLEKNKSSVKQASKIILEVLNDMQRIKEKLRKL